MDAYSIPTPVGKSEKKQNKINAGDVLISSEDPPPIQSLAPPAQGQVAGAATEEFAPLKDEHGQQSEDDDDDKVGQQLIHKNNVSGSSSLHTTTGNTETESSDPN